MKRLLMAEWWGQFARAALPRDAGATQRQEMRRAFYAGAHSILHGLIETLSPDREPTTDDLRVMENLERELSDFAEAVKAGRA